MALIGVWAYWPALNGGMLWDDDAHVTRPALQSGHGLERIWFELGATQQYYPMLHTAFWVEHRLWGSSTLGYHLVNLMWHAAAAVLLGLCLRRLRFAERAAWLGAGLWFLHPVMVESVAWISEQKNTLSAAGYFLAGWLYLRGAEDGRRRDYRWATVVFVFAVLTKTVAATLPAALLVVFWWREGGDEVGPGGAAGRGQRPRLQRGWLWHLRRLAPWLVWGAACGAVTAWVERRYIGAEGAAFNLDFVQRLALSGKVIGFYAGKLLWPGKLLFIYPRWTLTPLTAADWLPLAAAVGVAVVLIGLARRGLRGPLAAMLVFTGTLFPALGFVNVYPFLFSYVADHFQYLAAASLLAAIAWIIDRTPLAAVLWVLLPTGLAWASHRQSQEYRDAETLYRSTLAGNPDAWLAHYNLGVILEGRPNDAAAAMAEYRATLRLNPSHWPARNNLAALLGARGDLEGAISEYEAAIRLRPDFAEAHNNLGIALARVPGREADGIAQLRQAIQLRPNYDAAHGNLAGLLLHQSEGTAEAVAEYRRAVQLAPANAEYHYDLGNALMNASNDPAPAMAEYRAALRLDPHSVAARVNLATVLARAAATRPEALDQYRQALLDAPDNESVHFNYANALSRDRATLPAAINEYRTCVRLAPRDAAAHFLLAVALVRTHGSHAEAIAELQAALAAHPQFPMAAQLLQRLKNAPAAP
ncbi:MAG TPA: tetratricopeptide repeat protein [Opitutaceae bacterium]